MIIIPIGREDAGFQRYAWVTYGLILLNVLAFVLVCLPASTRDEAVLLRTWRDTVGFVRERPYLHVPLVAQELMPRQMQHRRPQPDPNVPEWRAALEQRQLDAMAADLRRRYVASDFMQLAHVPATGSLLTLLTSMFLHAGILHIAGNMLFLVATGPFVEDAFGRFWFALLYLSGGVIATLSFAYRFPNDITPLVGASGAIAAVMGAYLIRFALSRMRMLVIPIFFLPFWNYRFSLPALVVFPLWFLEQLVSMPAEMGSGVAVTAHVGGFAYGLLFAGVMRLAGIAKRDPGKSRSISTREAASFSDPRLNRALQAIQTRDYETATRELQHVLAQHPSSVHALRLALDVERKGNAGRNADSLATRLLEAYGAANDLDASTKLVAEFRGSPHARQFLARAAAVMERAGKRAEAADLLQCLAEREKGTANAIPTLVKLATLRRANGDRTGAEEALQQALAQPDCSPEWQRRIGNALTSL